MSPKGFAVLAGATALSLALAAYAVAGRDLPVTAAAQPEPMFEGLLDRLNEVETVRVTAGPEKLTLKRAGEGGWVVEERGGYPVEAAKVRELALGVANLRLVEPKTATPDRLPRLELEDPAKAEAKSRQVELLGKGGEVLASAVVGKAKYGLYGAGRSGMYVRRGGEEQAWLAAGEFRVPAAAPELIERELLDVPQAEVARATLGADGPSPLVVAKADPKAEAYTLEGAAPPPPGKRIDEDKLERVADSLSKLSLQDVRPLAQVPFPADAPKARFETWDGLRLDVRVARTGEGDKAEHWVALAVAEGAPLGPPEIPAAAAAGEAAAAPATPAKKPLAERAAEIRRKVDGWAFKLPEYLGSRLAWGAGDLLADVEPAS